MADISDRIVFLNSKLKLTGGVWCLTIFEMFR